MIEVKNLTKRYGTNTALNNVSFTVEEGTIVGFLGPNGAGKSTTMNIITGYPVSYTHLDVYKRQVQQYVEARNYSVVREFVGHGVGAKLHEDPSVPNYGTPGRGVRLLPGMTIAIEPMVTQGSCEVKILKDGWTTVTKDGKLAAHFEHSIAITPDGPVILTSLD